MKLLKNARVYAPEPLGVLDVILEGEKIRWMGKNGQEAAGPLAEVWDLEGRILAPGYIDNHVHITGGGGEGGPATRTPEAGVTELVRCGVTTAVGMLGTDTVSRSLENLLFKTRALEEEGISCYCLTGGYGCPPVTLCGSVERDVALVDKIIGVKTAMSDHRSSNPGGRDLIQLAAQARRGGLLAGCAGIVTIHTGGGKEMLEPLFAAAAESDVPPAQFLPTHMGRSEALFDQGLEWIRRGGQMDVTAGSDREENLVLAEKILRYWDLDPAGGRLSVSSDGFGSQPKFGKNMEYLGLTYATPAGLNQLIKILVLEKGAPLETALKLVTQTPASFLKLRTKGEIAPGLDADFVIYDEGMDIWGVIARGRTVLWEGKTLLRPTILQADS